ncbi:transcriptional regulator [Aquiflexum sp. TKW24L]|uniref:helix-turn-helix domain-containing protein n=1 Tax=Aquiflexum sp. TKW24L TaxID=2942212 RepID=UPI0020BE0CE5|nr:transcriptional regulator [Aquiflexum sp. TKW24L]MCL6261717.1 transcriptional regulator [Aquiflexum sp. TKW24L]
MKLTLIANEDQYQTYLERIDYLFDSQKGTPEGYELELLLALVKLYEIENFIIPKTDPITAIKIRMEDLGLKNKDLIPILGDKGNVSKILQGKRSLNVEMIRKLSKFLSLPVQILVGEEEVTPA